MAQQKRIQLVCMKMRVRCLAYISGLRVRRCPELWCGLQTQLASQVAVAVAVAVALAQAGSNSDSTPSLGTSICCKCGPEKQNKNKPPFIEALYLRLEHNTCCNIFYLTVVKFPLQEMALVGDVILPSLALATIFLCCQRECGILFSFFLNDTPRRTRVYLSHHEMEEKQPGSFW